MLNWLACLCPIGQGHTQGSTSKIVFDTIACRRGVNVNKSERERSKSFAGNLCSRVSSASFSRCPQLSPQKITVHGER